MKGVVIFPVYENNTKEAYNMDLSKIPNKLRGEPYFCLMKLEQKPGKTKKDKVPYRTNGARADPTNPEHFTSIENAMKVFDKGGYDGIGIGVFDDIIAIDIDDCVEDGKLNDFATEIVEALKTYAEFSISGTGVHIWARAPGLVYDNYLWQEDMDTILGKPVYISEFMPSIATGKKVIAFGDFSYYWILNRRPLAVRALKEKFELYDQTGCLGMEYIDGKLVNREAIKVMQIS